MKYKYFSLFIVLLIIIISYSNSINNDFVHRDDGKNVYENSDIKGFTKDNIKAIFTKSYVGMYLPFTMGTFIIDYELAELNPAIYHLTNLILHLLNTILIFYFFLLLSKRLDIPIIVSLLFGVHPINVDVVAWVSARGSLLYTFFFILSMIAYFYYIKSDFKKRYLYLSLLFFVFSLFSKSAAMSLPLVLLIMDWYYKRDWNKKLIKEKLLFFFFALVGGVITYYIRTEEGHLGGIYYSSFDKIVLSIYGLLFYFIEIFVPHHLSTYLPLPNRIGNFFSFKYYFASFWLLLIIFIIYKIIKSPKSEAFRRELIFGILFFLLNIIIILIKPFYGRELVAARYAYIPYIGMFFAIAKIYAVVTDKFQKLRPYLITFLALVAIFFSAFTYSRNKVWNNSIALWTDVIEKSPDCAFPYITRGFAKGEKEDYKGAIEDYNMAIKLLPDYYEPYYSRGLMKYYIQDFKGALEDYNMALKLSPYNTDAYVYDVYNNRGKVKLELKDYKGAVEDFTMAIRLNADKTVAYNNRGLAKRYLGDYQGAMQDLNKSIMLNPKFTDAYFNRGYLKMQLNDLEGAIKDFNTILKIDPNDAETYHYRGKARLMLKDCKKAIQDFDLFLYFNPNSAEAYSDRGYAKAYIEDYKGAVDDYNKAFELNPSDSGAFYKREIAMAFLDKQQGTKHSMGVLVLPQDIKKKERENNIKIDKAYNLFKSGLDKYFKKDYQGAIDDFNKSISFNPNNFNAYKNRAIARMALKDNANALVDFNQAIKLNNNDGDCYFNRGYLKSILKDYKGAIEDYNKAIEINPKDAEAFLYRADSKIVMGDHDGACNDWYNAYNLGFKDASLILNQNCSEFIREKFKELNKRK